MYEFRQLSDRPEDWDERILDYDTKTLFHSAAWLDHISDIKPSGDIMYFEIVEGDKAIGYYCALKIRKLGLPIYGSPLRGTGTNYLGPIVSREIDQGRLVRSFDQLMSVGRCLHLEMAHYWLDREIMEREGYAVHEDVTHLVPLANSEEEAWENLKSNARNRIRKARDNNLTAEKADSKEFVEQYISQLAEVFGKQGMNLPYGRRRVESLCTIMLEARQVAPIWVKSGGKVIATGVFPFDENCIYFWGGASWQEYQHLCPNELLHWTAMRFAVDKGIPLYNMCGGKSRFKSKFGGEDVPYLHYSKGVAPGLQLARRVYEKYHMWRRHSG